MLLHLQTRDVQCGVATRVDCLHEESKLHPGALYVFLDFFPQQLVVVVLLPGAVLLPRQRVVNLRAYNSDSSCLTDRSFLLLLLGFLEV